jgi:hypothetical protein
MKNENEEMRMTRMRNVNEMNEKKVDDMIGKCERSKWGI